MLTPAYFTPPSMSLDASSALMQFLEDDYKLPEVLEIIQDLPDVYPESFGNFLRLISERFTGIHGCYTLHLCPI